jgi:hypothetical protein
MGTRFNTAALVIPVILIFTLSVLSQSGQGKPQVDIVKKLMPNGGWPMDLPVKPSQRDSIIRKLKVAQGTAHGQRAQQVAFLLAAMRLPLPCAIRLQLSRDSVRLRREHGLLFDLAL